MPITNRNPILQWFITFPKSGDVSKIAFSDFLTKVKPIQYLKAVSETHSDGTPHLHVIVKFKKGITKSQFLNEIQLSYPNDNKRIQVEPIRSLDHTIDYIDKEDTEPYILGRKPISTSKLQFYASQLTFTNTLLGTNFTTAEELYDFYISSRDSGELPI